MKDDSVGKATARATYRALAGTQARLLGRRARHGEKPLVFYGGARSGNIGGTLVKIQRLQRAFPQTRGPFNLLYSLSNAPYLSRATLAALKARGVVIVHNQNGVFYPGWWAGDWAAENTRMAHAYQQADHVFWQSAFCRICADEFLGTRSGPGEVLFNAVDISRFAPPPERDNDAANSFTFLLTGKLQAHLAYRLEDTVAGLAAARAGGLDANLVVAGFLDAGARTALDAAARHHGVTAQVRFTGPYTQWDAPAIYGAAEAYIMTKHADPCPNAVIEAMACGLPIVFVANGGVPELVGPHAGVGIPAYDDWERPFRPDPDALGDAMLAVAANRAEMARAARARAEAQFDLRVWLDRHKTVFTQLLLETTGRLRDNG